MLKMLMSQNILVYVMLAAGAFYIGARIILSTYMGTLMKAASCMGTTRKKQLVRIRERFEDLGAVGYDIRSVDNFVDRFTGRMTIGRVKIHSMESFIRNMFIISVGAGIFGAFYEYYRTGAAGEILLIGTAVLTAELVAANLWDYSYRRNILQTTIKDYFNNSLAERMNKMLLKKEKAEDCGKTLLKEEMTADGEKTSEEYQEDDMTAYVLSQSPPQAAAGEAPEANEEMRRKKDRRGGAKTQAPDLSDELLEQLISSVIG